MSAIPTPSDDLAGKAKLDYQLELDKAKLDYQLVLDKRKLDYQQGIDDRKIEQGGSRWRELLWDKLVFSLVVAVIGAFAVWLVSNAVESRRQSEARDLEKYKLDESRQRFFLGKRLDATLQISAAVNAASSIFYRTSRGTPGDAKAAKEAMQQAVSRAADVLYQNEPLFGKNFVTDLERFLRLLRSLGDVDHKTWPTYRKFMASLSRGMHDLTRAVLDGKADDKLPKIGLAAIDFDRSEELKPQEYINAHFERWKNSTTR